MSLSECKAKSDELVSQVEELEEQVSQHQANITTLEKKQAEHKVDKKGDPVKLAEKMANADRDISVSRHAIDILKSRIGELVVTAPDRLADLKSAYRQHTKEVDEFNDKAKETFLSQKAIKDALNVLREAYSTANPENRALEEFLVHVGWNDQPGFGGCERAGYRGYDYDDYELMRPVESLVNSAAYREYQPKKPEPEVYSRPLYEEEGSNIVRVR